MLVPSMQAEVVKLEQEAAGIGLASEEQYAQYQRLKQVLGPARHLHDDKGRSSGFQLPGGRKSVHADQRPLINDE